MLLLSKKIDLNEIELPETLFVRNIDNRVFQGIVRQCLAQISGITLLTNSRLDRLIKSPGVKGICVDQDGKGSSVMINIELNVCYGFSIPEKSEEIHNKVSQEVTRLTGVHVSAVRIHFRGVVDAQEKHLASLTL